MSIHCEVGKYMMGYSDYGIVYDNENENLQLHRATRVNLTNNGDERSQTQKNIYCAIPFI